MCASVFLFKWKHRKIDLNSNSDLIWWIKKAIARYISLYRAPSHTHNTEAYFPTVGLIHNTNTHVVQFSLRVRKRHTHIAYWVSIIFVFVVIAAKTYSHHRVCVCVCDTYIFCYIIKFQTILFRYLRARLPLFQIFHAKINPPGLRAPCVYKRAFLF